MFIHDLTIDFGNEWCRTNRTSILLMPKPNATVATTIRASPDTHALYTDALWTSIKLKKKSQIQSQSSPKSSFPVDSDQCTVKYKILPSRSPW